MILVRNASNHLEKIQGLICPCTFCLRCSPHLYTFENYEYIFTYKLYSSLEAQLQGTTQDHLQIFNIELKAKMKSYQMPEQVPVVYCYTICVLCKISAMRRKLLILVNVLISFAGSLLEVD